jgi:outer membrane protein assembly factor BamB
MRTVRAAMLILMVSCFLPRTSGHAADWPIYRGPNQDGISPENVDIQWNGSGPKVVWRHETHTGFSSFSVGGGRVYTQVAREINGNPRETCLALDATTGRELWFADIAKPEYTGDGNTAGGGEGPRSTPTFSDGGIYLLTPDLVVHCLSARTGKLVWKRDLVAQHHGRNIHWSSAASVAVDGNLVFVAGGGPGESLLALNKKTGAVVWKTGDEKITHATPVVTTILGQRQVIFFMQRGPISVEPGTGAVLWRFNFPYKVSTAISPVVCGDIVYVSAAYDVGSTACRIGKRGGRYTTTQLWFSPGNEPVANHWSTPVCKDGYLYGMFGFKKFKKGPMKCVELATGKVMWEQPGSGQGNLILVGNRLVALAEDGSLVIVEPSPDSYKEIARAKVFNDKCWSTPAFADGKIYVRSISEGVCIDASGK